MIEQKRQLRKEISQLKLSLTSYDKQKASAQVLQSLLADKHLMESRNIVLFWSMPDEIPTPEIVECLYKTHRIFLPFIVGEDLQFRFYEGKENMLAEQQYGILQPTSDVFLQEGALQTAIVVPGVAFTMDGCRMGRGRGFYDRILACFPEAYKIGICYKCQIVESLPIEPHDVMMDRVICG